MIQTFKELGEELTTLISNWEINQLTIEHD